MEPVYLTINVSVSWYIVCRTFVALFTCKFLCSSGILFVHSYCGRMHCFYLNISVCVCVGVWMHAYYVDCVQNIAANTIYSRIEKHSFIDDILLLYSFSRQYSHL